MDAEKFFELTERFERLVAELNCQWMVYDDIFGNPASRDFSDAIGVVIYLSLIPSLVVGMTKPAIPVGFAPDDTPHESFARAFLAALSDEMSLSLGKPLPPMDASRYKFVPLRIPFSAELKDGTTLTIH